MTFSFGVGGKSNCHPLTQIKGGNMKKLLIVVCIALVVAFTGGFLTSHFTSASSNNASSGGNQQYDCGHDAQIQALMREIEIRQDKIKDLEKNIDFFYEAVIEMLRQFDIQFDWINELLGQINDANDEIRNLEKQINNYLTIIEMLTTGANIDGLELLDGAIEIQSDTWGWGYDAVFSLDEAISFVLWNMSFKAYTDLMTNGSVEVTLSVDGVVSTNSIPFEQVASDEDFEIFLYVFPRPENWLVNVWLYFFEEVEHDREIILLSAVLRTGGEL